MLKAFLRTVSIAACIAFASHVNAQTQTTLDNTQPWSIRMIESEMVRFPEAWQSTGMKPHNGIMFTA